MTGRELSVAEVKALREDERVMEVARLAEGLRRARAAMRRAQAILAGASTFGDVMRASAVLADEVGEWEEQT